MILYRTILFISLLFVGTLGYSQSFNVEQVAKAKLITVSGGASANAIMYSGNAAREPFSYFLNGNININVAGLYSLPFSFSYTSQKLGYNKPILMNRLSIHPSYKWITTHIGDVSMSFSPYTLSGHLFTGFGVDLTPQGKFKISAMYGRLLKSSEFDSNNPSVVPAYKRYGYGLKTTYAFEKVNLGLTFFKANDQINSLSILVPFELGVAPKDNVALSFDTSFKLFQKLQVITEIGNSSITEDSRETTAGKSSGVASFFLNPNATTTTYNAFKGQLVYPAGKGTLGLGYERIDPNYRTLGGYFFNNDLENITVNASQSLLQDKVSVALNLGMQKDNLDNKKQTQMKRLVSAVNLDYKANQKLNLNFNYSNFQSFTNSRNQFDYINQTSDFAYLDTLNFRQVNQNAAITINFLLKNDKRLKKSISGNFSMQDAINQQQGQTIQGGATALYNTALSYVVGYPENSLNIIGSLNTTLNRLETGKSLILGPTLGVNKLFMDKKLNTSFSSSYNTSYNNGDKQNDIINLRLNGSYIYLEKHNFNLGVVSLFNKSAGTKNNDITANLTYSYSFDKIKLRANKEVKKEENLAEAAPLKINFKKLMLEGTRAKIIKQLQDLQAQLHPLPLEETTKLAHLLELASVTPDDSQFKIKILDYLAIYHTDVEILEKYHRNLSYAILKFEQEMIRKDQNVEIIYTNAIAKVNQHQLHGVIPEKATDKAAYNSYLKLVERSSENQDQLLNHRWILNQFSTLAKTPPKELLQNDYLATFAVQEIDASFKLLSTQKSTTEIVSKLEQKLVPYYYELALKKSKNDPVELKYISK
jgi:hypothetical protein